MSEISEPAQAHRNQSPQTLDTVAQVIVDAADLTDPEAWLLPSASVGDDGHVGEIIVRLPVEEPRLAAQRGLVDD